MTEQLACSYANRDQQLAAYRNIHEFWSHGRTLEEHLKWRSASPQHNRAMWCVGSIDDQVVTSLGCYSMQFHWDGRQIAGIFIGAVHTLPDHRGRGYAPRLISWAEEQQRQQGALVSALFSDIDPNYYARLGYERCEGCELDIRVAQDAAPARFSWLLQPMDPHHCLPKIQAWYQASQDNLPLWVVRDDDYWQYMLGRSSADRFFVLVDEQGQEQGYVRLQGHGASWVIHDWGLAKADVTNMAAMIEAVLGLAAEKEVTSITGWLPRLQGAMASFNCESRPQEITMFKSFDSRYQVHDGIVQAAAFLREIDHV